MAEALEGLGEGGGAASLDLVQLTPIQEHHLSDSECTSEYHKIINLTMFLIFSQTFLEGSRTGRLVHFFHGLSGVVVSVCTCVCDNVCYPGQCPNHHLDDLSIVLWTQGCKY